MDGKPGSGDLFEFDLSKIVDNIGLLLLKVFYLTLEKAGIEIEQLQNRSRF
jgi:hypothetical protein